MKDSVYFILLNDRYRMLSFAKKIGTLFEWFTNGAVILGKLSVVVVLTTVCLIPNDFIIAFRKVEQS